MPAKTKKAEKSKAKDSKKNGVEPNVLHIVAQITDICKSHSERIEQLELKLARVMSRLGL